MPIIVTNFDINLRRFWVSLDILLFNKNYILDGVIDTGCTTSLISGKDLFKTDIEAMSKKLDALDNKVPFRVGGGVNKDRDERERVSYSNTHILRLQGREDLIFKFDSDLDINGLRISGQRLFVGYDFKCVTLIGMDILEKFHMFIGFDKSNVYKLVACLKGDKQSELEFYNYLEDNFDLIQKPRLLARLFRREHNVL